MVLYTLSFNNKNSNGIMHTWRIILQVILCFWTNSFHRQLFFSCIKTFHECIHATTIHVYTHPYHTCIHTWMKMYIWELHMTDIWWCQFSILTLLLYPIHCFFTTRFFLSFFFLIDNDYDDYDVLFFSGQLWIEPIQLSTQDFYSVDGNGTFMWCVI